MVMQSSLFNSIRCLLWPKDQSLQLSRENVHVRTLSYTSVPARHSKAFLCVSINPSFAGLSHRNMFLILSAAAPEGGFQTKKKRGKTEQRGKKKRLRERNNKTEGEVRQRDDACQRRQNKEYLQPCCSFITIRRNQLCEYFKT